MDSFVVLLLGMTEDSHRLSEEQWIPDIFFYYVIPPNLQIWSRDLPFFYQQRRYPDLTLFGGMTMPLCHCKSAFIFFVIASQLQLTKQSTSNSTSSTQLIIYAQRYLILALRVIIILRIVAVIATIFFLPRAVKFV